jgi:predicted ester cyclase
MSNDFLEPTLFPDGDNEMENLLYKDLKEFTDLTEEERANLAVVMEELKGWDHADVDRVLSVMSENAIYHDITLPPAKGHDGIRAFGEGWTTAAPDFSIFIEKFIVKGKYVVNVGRISGSIQGEYFGLPATKKPFDCMYCQVAVVENGKITYVRDHWDSITMSHQVGWD